MNPQLRGMEDSPVKELNEMEASKLSGIEFKRMVVRMLKGAHRQLQGTEWELQQ